MVIVRWRYEHEARVRVESFPSIASAKQWIRAVIPGRKDEAQAVLIDTHPPFMRRSKNPSPKRHTAKWDRCVRDVKKRGTAVSPEAVCTAALAEMRKRGGRRTDRNPLPKLTSVSRVYYIVCASKGAQKYCLTRRGKLTHAQSSAARFRTVAEAHARARAHLTRYPSSRAYRFTIQLAY